jgi:hypothetical protein
LYIDTECSRIGGSAERNCQPKDSALTTSVSGTDPGAGAAGGVGTRATGFAFVLKLSPPKEPAIFPRRPGQGWQERSGACVIVLAFCAASKREWPQNLRIYRYEKARCRQTRALTRGRLSYSTEHIGLRCVQPDTS